MLRPVRRTPLPTPRWGARNHPPQEPQRSATVIPYLSLELAAPQPAPGFRPDQPGEALLLAVVNLHERAALAVVKAGPAVDEEVRGGEDLGVALDR